MIVVPCYLNGIALSNKFSFLKINAYNCTYGKKRDYVIRDENNIKGFFAIYRYLSNFEKCDVYFDGNLYGSSEDLYGGKDFRSKCKKIIF